MRMSLEKRIELGNAMIVRWNSAGIVTDKSLSFVSDMLLRMQSGRGMTPRQRDWYDEAVQRDPPATHNQELVKKLLNAANLPGMQRHKQTLLDFAQRAQRGWTFSEKQESFVKGLLEAADEETTNGPWRPTEEELEEIKLGVQLCKKYNNYYLGQNHNLYTALKNTKAWLEQKSLNASVLDKRDAQRMMTCCKGARALMLDFAIRFPIGSLVDTRQGEIGLVLSAPIVSESGEPSFQMLIDGKFQTKNFTQILFPRKSSKKANNAN